jgi:hypothetical protein
MWSFVLRLPFRAFAMPVGSSIGRKRRKGKLEGQPNTLARAVRVRIERVPKEFKAGLYVFD